MGNMISLMIRLFNTFEYINHLPKNGKEAMILFHSKKRSKRMAASQVIPWRSSGPQESSLFFEPSFGGCI